METTTNKKRTKTGGRGALGLEVLGTSIAVPKSDKPFVAKFRDYLNQESTRDVAMSMLDELERMAKC